MAPTTTVLGTSVAGAEGHVISWPQPARFNADLVRLKTAGKAHKVAIVAVMRKLWRTPCCDSSVA